MLVISLTCIFQLVFEIPSHKYVLIIIDFCHGNGVQILKLEICGFFFLLFKLKFIIK